MPKPKIAVMLDENTSCGGTHYETHKDYFSAIDQAGGVPYGIPYLADLVDPVINEFDGFFRSGAGFVFRLSGIRPARHRLFCRPNTQRLKLRLWWDF